MFCTKCGNEVKVVTRFCDQCGLNLNGTQCVKSDSENKSIKATNNIKQYIDDSIKKDTKYQSADDLLENSKPLQFIIVCMLVSVVMWFSALKNSLTDPSFETIMFILVTVGTGYLLAYFVGIFKSFRLKVKTYDFAENIDKNDLLRFMEQSLKQVSHQFDEFKYKGENCISFEYDGRVSLKINFDKTSERDYYYIFPSKLNVSRVTMFSSVNFMSSKNNAGFSEYNVLYKTVPIINAVIQYYLENNLEDTNV